MLHHFFIICMWVIKNDKYIDKVSAVSCKILKMDEVVSFSWYLSAAFDLSEKVDKATVTVLVELFKDNGEETFIFDNY